MDEIEKRLPLSNSCGQHGESYQDMRCPAGESFMECAPDPNMQMSAVDKGQYSEGTTPPFFCGPSWYFPSTGYFDVISSTIMNDNPLANRAGRTDVSACCWWGRGSVSQKIFLFLIRNLLLTNHFLNTSLFRRRQKECVCMES